MSVVVRERAPDCAASRARRASGREAAIRNFCFVLPIEMRGLQRKLQADLLVKHFFTKCYRRFWELFQTSGSPECRAICSRAASRRRTTSCQSEVSLPEIFGHSGGESVIVTEVGRGKSVPSRRKRRVPASETGMMGTPVKTAALNAPS